MRSMDCPPPSQLPTTVTANAQPHDRKERTANEADTGADTASSSSRLHQSKPTQTQFHPWCKPKQTPNQKRAMPPFLQGHDRDPARDRNRDPARNHAQNSDGSMISDHDAHEHVDDVYLGQHPLSQDPHEATTINTNTKTNAPASSSWRWHEARLFLELAGVTSLMYLGFAVSPLVVASVIGRRLGPVYLSAFSLANLTGNLCTQTLVTGLLGAMDTLGGQAMGQNHFAELGRLAVRGVLVAGLVLLPINVVLVLHLEALLMFVGQDPVAARLANEWYTLFCFSLPFSVLYQSLCKFLTVQHILAPIVGTSLVSLCMLGPLLEVCARWGGFPGTAVAYVGFWGIQSGLLLAYTYFVQPHDARTWQPQRHNNHTTSNYNHQESMLVALWKSAMHDRRAVQKFVSLGLGGVLAQCEWVFWEALGLVVGNLGIVPLTAHTIPTQIVMNVSTLPIAAGIALAVRMGILLPKSVSRTQGMAMGVLLGSLLVFGLGSLVLYACRGMLISVFVSETLDEDTDTDTDADMTATEDGAVLALAESIWPQVSWFNLALSVFGILAGISTGLGQQWILGTINAVWLWGFGMPVIYYTIVLRPGGGLQDAWFWMTVAYTGINASLLVVFWTVDWDEIQRGILSGGCSGSSGNSSAIAATMGEGSHDNTHNDDNDDDDAEFKKKPNENTALLGMPL